MVPCDCVLLHEPETNNKRPRHALVPYRTAVKFFLRDIGRGKSNPTLCKTTLFYFGDNVVSFGGHENCSRFATLS